MNDILVIYYSFTGNSKKVAEYVKDKLNADILELEPKEPFSSDYDEVVREWQNNDIKKDVEIKKIDKDLSKYNKIILITGIWWYGITPVMKKFLREYDLSNKDIIYIANSLQESITELLKLKKRLHNFGYFEDEEFLKNKMVDFDFWISRLKK